MGKGSGPGEWEFGLASIFLAALSFAKWFANSVEEGRLEGAARERTRAAHRTKGNRKARAAGGVDHSEIAEKEDAVHHDAFFLAFFSSTAAVVLLRDSDAAAMLALALFECSLSALLLLSMLYFEAVGAWTVGELGVSGDEFPHVFACAAAGCSGALVRSARAHFTLLLLLLLLLRAAVRLR